MASPFPEFGVLWTTTNTQQKMTACSQRGKHTPKQFESQYPICKKIQVSFLQPRQEKLREPVPNRQNRLPATLVGQFHGAKNAGQGQIDRHCEA